MAAENYMTNATADRGRSVLEWIAWACLLASPLVAPVLIGGSRLWGSGPLMSLVFFGALLVAVRALRWHDDAAALRIPPGALAWLGFLGYSAVAIFCYGTPYEARIELLRAVSLWAAYWSWANLGSKSWRWVLGLLLAAATANALFGIYNHVQGTPSNILLFDRVAEVTDYEARISGTYFCPNHWASWLAMLAPVALAVVFSTEAGVVLRLLAAVALVSFPPAIHYSQSRAGLLGLVAGLMVTILVLVWRRSRLWFAVLLFVLPALAAGGGYLYWEHSPTIRARINAALMEGKTGDGFRVNQWRDTLLLMKVQPWVGCGPGAYGWAVEVVRTHNRDGEHQPFYAHNDYLHSLAEYGVVGTLLVGLPLAWLLMRLLGAAWRRKTSPTNAVLLAGLLGAWAAALMHATLDFNLRIYANAATLAVLSGLVVGRLQSQRDWSLPVARRALCGACAAVCALLLVVIGWTLVSYFIGVRALHAQLAQDYATGERAARLALRVDSGNWYAADTLGTILFDQAQALKDDQQSQTGMKAAAAAFAWAARGNLRNMDTRGEQGLALVKGGQPVEGMRLLRLAADATPLVPHFRIQLALQLRKMGLYEAALTEFRRVAKIKADEVTRDNLDWLEQKVNSKGKQP